MKIIKVTFILLVLITSTTSCKQKISYTQELQKRHKLTESELSKLQYYLVNDVILYAGSKDGSTTLEDGEIVINEEENIDKIIFRSGTKGVIEKVVSPNKIAIRFENGEGKTLLFGSSSSKGRYTLQAEKWNSNGQGQIKYDGQIYHSSRGSSTAYIAVKLRKNKDYNNTQRVVKGKKLK